MATNSVILLLGTNLGDRLRNLNEAAPQIERTVGKVIKRSRVYETASWGNDNLPSFLNQVIEAETTLLPQELMKSILLIEKSMGRSRTQTQKYESRVIDIDILFYADEIIQLPDLIIPHPRLHERKFTLIPLVEIHPSKIHPVFHETFLKLLEKVTDPLQVKEYKPDAVIK